VEPRADRALGRVDGSCDLLDREALKVPKLHIPAEGLGKLEDGVADYLEVLFGIAVLLLVGFVAG